MQDGSHAEKNARQKETIQIERISSLPEKPNPWSFTIRCSVDIFNINAIADLGASVNIMSKSVLEELSLADPKNANIIVEMADKTSREFSLGIEEDRVKIKINKQECNFTTPVSEHLNERPTSQDELNYGV
ncbi:phospholipase-like protein, partial [Tanacetum coccineum]